ncbi:MAG: hypothetical protein HC886_13495 [Leptolyngbyaceae cyanobacterium SM1_1_3]|nr:hypothetical protein [Leptolyngbyaceae cyanobacterium SM1_1_3]NJN04788.1 hypothetical protein [Leptolyngbyaceae cyanobacterium RM1_1_2]NJO09030.1 hypothetical protein [Leptolyngbyaceae cyanobacterium SL_1_1]
MYTVEVTLQSNPLPLTVQKKEVEVAQKLYQAVLSAMKTGEPNILEMACDQQVDKQVAVLSRQVMAVQIYEKSGTATGKQPGFFALLGDEVKG